MSDRPRAGTRLLELHRETIRDLTEQEAENVRGGIASLACSGGGGTVVVSTLPPTKTALSLVNPTDPITRA